MGVECAYNCNVEHLPLKIGRGSSIVIIFVLNLKSVYNMSDSHELVVMYTIGRVLIARF